MNIRDLKQQAASSNNKPIRLIKSNTIEKKREKEAEEEKEDIKEMKGMTFKPLPRKEEAGERVAMNISADVPPAPVLGVDIKESIEAEVFGPGGPFEKYKQEKLKEALQFMEDQKAEAEMEGKTIVEGGVDLKPVVPAEVAEQAKIEESYDEFGDPIPRREEPKKEPTNIIHFDQSENDPKFKFKVQEDDIFD